MDPHAQSENLIIYSIFLDVWNYWQSLLDKMSAEKHESLETKQN